MFLLLRPSWTRTAVGTRMQQRRSHARTRCVQETGRPWHNNGTQGVSPDAVRPCVCGLLRCSGSSRRCSRRRHLIVNLRIAGMKSENSGNRVFITALLCGRLTGDRTQLSLERFSAQQALRPAGTGNICRRNPFAQVETLNSNRSPASEVIHGTRSFPESFSMSRVTFPSIIELCTTGDMSPLSTADLATTTTTMTLSPLQATRMNLCHQVSWSCLPRACGGVVGRR